MQQIGRAATYVWRFIFHIAEVHRQACQDVLELTDRGKQLLQMDVARRKKARQPYMDAL